MKNNVVLHKGDSYAILAELPENSVDAIVTDPPYGISFLGRSWDAPENIAFNADFWRLALRVLKPGGHLVAFSANRTYHRMTIAIEDAGFEIRDALYWAFGQGFPKSLDVSKALDKEAGHWRGRAGAKTTQSLALSGVHYERTPKGEPVTDEAKLWDGWGTALKPCIEPICMARKPLKCSVTANVLKQGTGALNIGGCRIGRGDSDEAQGRWPTQLLLEDAPEVLSTMPSDKLAFFPTFKPDLNAAQRVFYAPKVGRTARGDSKHPTLKPVSLMRWLCRLITPPGGTILDPFAGSGTTAQAACDEGFDCILVERETEYQDFIAKRFGLDGFDPIVD